MPIDTSIYRAQQPVQIQTPNPLDLMTAAARMEDVRAQVDQRRLAGEAARQKAIDEAQVRSVMAGVGGDVDAGIAKLYSVNPRAAASLEEQVGKARKEHVEAVTKTLANQNTQLDHYLKVWGLVGDQPSLDAIRPMFVKSFPDLEKVLPTDYGDGTAVQRVSDLALSRKDQLEQKQKVVDLFANGKVNEAIGTGLSQANTPEEWNQFKTGMKAMGAPDAMLATYGEFSPENKVRAGQLAISPAKREELAGQAATRAQTAANQAAQQANQAAQLNVSRGHLAVAEGQLAVARQRLAKGTGTDQDRTALMQAVIENPGLWDQITPSERGKIAGDLNARGFTGFGKPLSETAVKQIAESKSAIASLTDLREVLKKNEQYLGPLAGLQALNPYSDARKAQADIDLVRQRVGKALEGGVLRKEDEEKYRQILATLRDEPSTALYKVDRLIANVQRDIDTYTHEQRLAGRRVPQGAPAPTGAATTGGSPSGPRPPRVGERRSFNGRLGEWDGRGWKAVP